MAIISTALHTIMHRQIDSSLNCRRAYNVAFVSIHYRETLVLIYDSNHTLLASANLAFLNSGALRTPLAWKVCNDSRNSALDV